jgi:hypothetical protein
VEHRDHSRDVLCGERVDAPVADDLDGAIDRRPLLEARPLCDVETRITPLLGSDDKCRGRDHWPLRP